MNPKPNPQHDLSQAKSSKNQTAPKPTQSKRAFSRREILRLLGLGTVGLVVGSSVLQSKPAAPKKTQAPTSAKALRRKQARAIKAARVTPAGWVYKLEPVPGIRYPRALQRKMLHARFATPQEAFAAMKDPTVPFRVARRRNRSQKGAKI
jgi:hypothetical protein